MSLFLSLLWLHLMLFSVIFASLALWMVVRSGLCLLWKFCTAKPAVTALPTSGPRPVTTAYSMPGRTLPGSLLTTFTDYHHLQAGMVISLLLIPLQ